MPSPRISPSSFLLRAPLCFFWSIHQLFFNHLPKSLQSFWDTKTKNKKTFAPQNHIHKFKPYTTASVSRPWWCPSTWSLQSPSVFYSPPIFQSHQFFLNQSHKFPTMSSRRNQYFFVLYHHNTSSIYAVAIPNCQAANIHSAWEHTYQTLLYQGHPTVLYIFSNEWLQDLKYAFANYIIIYQQDSLKEHQANAAIQTIIKLKTTSLHPCPQ